MKNNMKTLNDNFLTRANKKRYNEATEIQQKKIDALYNTMSVADYQLKLLKRKRKYPEIGDIFRLMPPNNQYLYGIVVNNHIKNINTVEQIVIMIFETKEKLIDACNRKILPDDLFIPSKIITKLYWTNGYFETIDKIENFQCNADYGFYTGSRDMFLDEYGTEMDHQPQIVSLFGITTNIGIARAVYCELIYRNMI